MRGVIILHVGFDVGRYGLHQRIVGEGVHVSVGVSVVGGEEEVREGSVGSAFRQWMLLRALRQDMRAVRWYVRLSM